MSHARRRRWAETLLAEVRGLRSEVRMLSQNAEDQRRRNHLLGMAEGIRELAWSQGVALEGTPLEELRADAERRANHYETEARRL
jgi:hypothetical protein